MKKEITFAQLKRFIVENNDQLKSEIVSKVVYSLINEHVKRFGWKYFPREEILQFVKDNFDEFIEKECEIRGITDPAFIEDIKNYDENGMALSWRVDHALDVLDM